MPENDTREQLVTTGQAQDLSWKMFKYGVSNKVISIPLKSLTTTTKESLLDALEADANYQVTIAPDSHVDLGNGAGTSIVAMWVDKIPNFIKNTHNSWDGVLNFIYIS